MDKRYRRPTCVLQKDSRAMNRKEDIDLRHKLKLLDKQYRYTCKLLQQRKDLLIQQQRSVKVIKLCEPKAIVKVAMKEIDEHTNSERPLRGIHTSDGGRFYSSKSQSHNGGSEQPAQGRSISAPPAPIKPTRSVRHQGSIKWNVSLMQLKNISTIDSISQKELARQQQQAREEMERLKQLQRETLHNRVRAFIEHLNDTDKMGLLMQPP